MGLAKRTVAVGFGAILVLLVVLVGVTSGIGGPSVPDDAIAFVDEVSEGEITQEEFDSALTQAAVRQGLNQPPEPGTPQYDLIKDSAMADVLLARWVRGEAEELGIEVTDREIDERREQIIEQEFGGQRQFDRFLEQNDYTEEEARERIELQIITERIQEEVVPRDLEIPDDEVERFYEQNIEQFQTPEQRDVRSVVTREEAQAQQALERLQADDSPASWERVARQLSTDEATADAGGLRQGVVQGQSEPALDEEIFGASEGELVGPIETPGGFSVFQVEAIEPESTQPLDEQTREQISQTLVTQRQQELATAFQTDFVSKWVSRTVCDEEYLMDRCGNAPPPPDQCVGDDPGEEIPADPVTGEPSDELSCPAFVPSLQPVPPSEAGQIGAQGLPQGPVTPLGENALEGTTPLGLPGAPPGAPAPPAPGAPAPPGG